MNQRHNATECVLLTGVGRSAIAVVAVTGPQAAEFLQHCFRPNHHKPLAAGQVRYGQWNPAALSADDQSSSESSPSSATEHSVVESNAVESNAGESIVVVPRQTGETAFSWNRPQAAGTQVAPADGKPEQLDFEIHCHGGQAAAERIVEDLIALGAVNRLPHPTEGLPSPLGRARHQNHDQRLIDEASEMLLRCPTAQTAAIALEQTRGALAAWRTNALGQLAADERAFSLITAQAKRLTKRGAVGLRLDQPWNLVLAGPPNVGKSSLLNAMVGYDRSITMDLPGTTRDVLEAQTVYQGWPMRLLDTAGLHHSDQPIERQGIESAIEAVKTADAVALVLQADTALETHPTAARQPATLDSHIVELLGQTSNEHDPQAAHRVLWVWNKCDLAGAPDMLPELPGTVALLDHWIETSATTPSGIEHFMSQLIRLLKEPLYTSLEAAQDASAASVSNDSGQATAVGPVPVCQRQQAALAQIAECTNANALRTLLQAL